MNTLSVLFFVDFLSREWHHLSEAMHDTVSKFADGSVLVIYIGAFIPLEANALNDSAHSFTPSDDKKAVL